MKQKFEKQINFIAFELQDSHLSAHILFAPKNATYCMANSVEEFPKLIGDFLHNHNVPMLSCQEVSFYWLTKIWMRQTDHNFLSLLDI